MAIVLEVFDPKQFIVNARGSFRSYSHEVIAQEKILFYKKSVTLRASFWGQMYPPQSNASRVIPCLDIEYRFEDIGTREGTFTTLQEIQFNLEYVKRRLQCAGQWKSWRKRGRTNCVVTKPLKKKYEKWKVLTQILVDVWWMGWIGPCAQSFTVVTK